MVHKPNCISDQEWMSLIHECRTSGLSDHDWCESRKIGTGSFYYHIRRLRSQGCAIPKAAFSSRTPEKQEVVPLTFQDSSPACSSASVFLQKEKLQDTPAVKLFYQNVSIEIFNHAEADTIRNVVAALRSLC